MAFLDRLNDGKDRGEIALLVFRDKGFSAHYKDKGMFSNVVTSGYDRISPEIIAQIEDQKIPMVDASNLGTGANASNAIDRLLIQMPMVAGNTETAFEFPFSGMSRAPAEIVASLYEKMGAKLYNIESVNLVPEMFRNMSQKETLLSAGFFANNEDAVKEAMTMEDSKTFKLPGGDKLKGTEIAAFYGSLSESFDDLADQYAKLEEARKGVPYANPDKTKNPEWDKLSSQSHIVQSGMTNLERMVARAGYEGALVIAGEKTDKEATASAKAWCNNYVTKMLAKYKEEGLENTKGKFKHLYDGLKEGKIASDKAQKVNVDRSIAPS